MIRIMPAAALCLLSVLVAPSHGEDLSKLPFPLSNVVPPLADTDDPLAEDEKPDDRLPIVVPPFDEHVRGTVPESLTAEPLEALSVQGGTLVLGTGKATRTVDLTTWSAPATAESVPDVLLATRVAMDLSVDARTRLAAHRDTLAAVEGLRIQDSVEDAEYVWLASNMGLYALARNELQRHGSYGTGGPLATDVTALAIDGRGALWTGSPVGLGVRDADGSWRAVRGRDGLPVEEITAIEVDANDRLWIGTQNGLIHYRPYDGGRQWFYREGLRYLPHNVVRDVGISADGKSIYTATEAGLGRLNIVATTLLERAETIEHVLNQRHRRRGLVASARLTDPADMESWDISDNDNDGLWTGYHVVAMSLAYGTTGDPAAKASAMEGMHALYMLQNVSGTPGLVARSVLPKEKALALGKDKPRKGQTEPQWRLTADGETYWKSDTSSDEIDGHYYAFYAYWEHIAKNDPVERERCIAQVRTLSDYIVDNGYVLLDWDGERTRWGFWAPELLNNHPRYYLENGLNSLQILSFLKTTYYITGDEKYQQHYMKLITEHHYLSNVLLEKKVYPDSDNHSDNQLAYVAWYPILQIEKDPNILSALRKGVRRHYKTLNRDRSSFFYFVTATVDPHYVDIESAVLNLKRIPTDRRQWTQKNSHRADIVFDPRVDRFGKAQLLTALPVDERKFDRWNDNVYLPDGGNGGDHADAGADFLMPYWMGRYHGFIAEAEVVAVPE
jgi:hypothetical protein